MKIYLTVCLSPCTSLPENIFISPELRKYMARSNINITDLQIAIPFLPDKLSCATPNAARYRYSMYISRTSINEPN